MKNLSQTMNITLSLKPADLSYLGESHMYVYINPASSLENPYTSEQTATGGEKPPEQIPALIQQTPHKISNS